jgi:hypothetical protein
VTQPPDDRPPAAEPYDVHKYDADEYDADTDPADYVEPSEEQLAARAVRANRATRGALAGILGLEALVTLLVPRAIAYTSSGLGPTRAGLLIGLAVVMVAAAGLVRRPWGIALGSVLQLAFILTGIVLSSMYVIGIIFAAIWLALLNLRHELVGTPGGLRMFVS